MNKILIGAFAILGISSASAQLSSIAGAGLSYSPSRTRYVNIGDGTAANTQVFSYNVEALAVGAFIYPKYHLKQEKPGKGEKAKPYSLSVGAPLLIAAQVGFGQSSLAYSIYPTADINVGSCNINNADKVLGAYLGVGFGIQNTNNVGINSLTSTSLPISSKYKTYPNGTSALTATKGSGKGIGPMIHFGFEFPGLFAGGAKNGLRFAFQPAVNRQGASYYTVCLQQGFGGNRRW
jgi:hypothetical protein